MDVLIIDDEKAVRDSTLLALEMEDHYAEAVSSGMVGIQRLKEEVFDLVFLDLNWVQDKKVKPRVFRCRVPIF
ncbi:MAG: hypothetical protein KA250_10740 [Verrucomicrobiales bacterium]|nr:hypothetical protein [Verrucomicrobiales bacterium]